MFTSTLLCSLLTSFQLHDSGTNSALENLLHARDAFLRLSRYKPADTGAIYCGDAYREVQVHPMLAAW